MKKLLALTLAMVMALSLASVAFAYSYGDGKIYLTDRIHVYDEDLGCLVAYDKTIHTIEPGDSIFYMVDYDRSALYATTESKFFSGYSIYDDLLHGKDAVESYKLTSRKMESEVHRYTLTLDYTAHPVYGHPNGYIIASGGASRNFLDPAATTNRTPTPTPNVGKNDYSFESTTNFQFPGLVPGFIAEAVNKIISNNIVTPPPGTLSNNYTTGPDINTMIANYILDYFDIPGANAGYVHITENLGNSAVAGRYYSTGSPVGTQISDLMSAEFLIQSAGQYYNPTVIPMKRSNFLGQTAGSAVAAAEQLDAAGTLDKTTATDYNVGGKFYGFGEMGNTTIQDTIATALGITKVTAGSGHYVYNSALTTVVTSSTPNATIAAGISNAYTYQTSLALYATGPGNYGAVSTTLSSYPVTSGWVNAAGTYWYGDTATMLQYATTLFTLRTNGFVAGTTYYDTSAASFRSIPAVSSSTATAGLYYNSTVGHANYRTIYANAIAAATTNGVTNFTTTSATQYICTSGTYEHNVYNLLHDHPNIRQSVATDHVYKTIIGTANPLKATYVKSYANAVAEATAQLRTGFENAIALSVNDMNDYTDEVVGTDHTQLYNYLLEIKLKPNATTKRIDLYGDLAIAKNKSAAKANGYIKVDVTVLNKRFEDGADQAGSAYVAIDDGKVVFFEDDADETDIEFADLARFVGKMSGQSPVNLKFNTTYNTAFGNEHDYANLDFLTFVESPMFHHIGYMYIYGDEDAYDAGDLYCYEIAKDGTIKEITTYNRSEGAFEIRTRTLGAYVLSNVALNIPEPIPEYTEPGNDKHNPPTGA